MLKIDVKILTHTILTILDLEYRFLLKSVKIQDVKILWAGTVKLKNFKHFLTL